MSPPPQEHDRTLMDSVLQAGLPLATMLAINCCCMAYQVYYWSTVANGWGDAISPSMLLLAAGPPHSPWHWPPEQPLARLGPLETVSMSIASYILWPIPSTAWSLAHLPLLQ